MLFACLIQGSPEAGRHREVLDSPEEKASAATHVPGLWRSQPTEEAASTIGCWTGARTARLKFVRRLACPATEGKENYASASDANTVAPKQHSPKEKLSCSMVAQNKVRPAGDLALTLDDLTMTMA